MIFEDLKRKIKEIVAKAQLLSAKHTNEGSAAVNYACIFTQNPKEFEELLSLTAQMGRIAEQTAMGPVFQIEPLETVAGTLQLLKIRRPDPKRPERGDADFTVSNYETFKRAYLSKPGFSLITRPRMEMIELADPSYDVLAYYSHPTLSEVLRLD